MNNNPENKIDNKENPHIFAICIRKHIEPKIEKTTVYDVGHINYFFRNNAKEFINFAISLIDERTQNKLGHMNYTYEQYVVHVNKTESTTVCVITDNAYPERIATSLTHIIEKNVSSNVDINNANINNLLTDYIKTYKNPRNADKLYKIQCELDEINNIMHQNVDDLLERDENLDSLMAKSHDLSIGSKKLFDESKKLNRWCPSCAIL